MPVLELTESELRGCVGFDEQCLRMIEVAFTWISEDTIRALELDDMQGVGNVRHQYLYVLPKTIGRYFVGSDALRSMR